MKFRSLVKNEIIKLFSKKSTFVFCAVIIAFTVLWSVVDDKDILSLGGSVSNYNQYDIAGAEKLPYASFAYSVDAEYIDNTEEVFKDNVRRAVSYGITKDDWRAGIYIEIQENVNQITSNNADIYYGQLSIKNTDDEEIKASLAEGIETLKAENKKLLEMQDILWNIIDTDDFSYYAESEISNVKNSVSEAKAYFGSIESNLKSQGGTEEELSVIHDLNKKVFASLDKVINVYENIGEYDLSDKYVVYQEMVAIKNAVAGIKSEMFFDRSTAKAFIESETYPFDDYDNYCEFLENYSETIEKRYISVIAVGTYAIENGYDEMTVTDGARNNYRSILTFSFYEYIQYFGILIAGIIVASEYSRKTINMLVIRPISRTSLLLSKYVSVLLTTLTLTVATLFVGFIFCGVRYGFADYFQPYIGYSSGAAYSVPYVLWFLGKAALSWLSIAFAVTFAFMLSTVTKTSAVSIVVPIIFESFIGIINLLITALIPAAVKWLPTTYVTLWSYIYNGIPTLTADSGLDGMYSLFYGSADVNIYYGAFTMLVLSVLLYMLANGVFRRRDIK